MAMTLDWFYQLGSWNPQLARELKGRVTPRSLSSTVFATLAVQGLLLLYFLGTLPDKFSTDHPLCTGKPLDAVYTTSSFKCIITGDVVGINWPLWWSNLYQALSWALPFVVLIAGVYLLIGDLGKEEKRGTLNFIRLSPQTSESVLLGKILGVPIVPYVAVLLAVPLHLWAAIAGGIPVGHTLSLYLLTLGICSCFFISSLLYAFMGGVQGWVGALAVLFTYNVLSSLMMLLFAGTRAFNRFGGGMPLEGLAWYKLPLGSSLWLIMPFVWVTLGIAAYWLWTAANRRFRNPNTSLLSKSQSYLATASFSLWIMGFTMRDRGDYDPLTVDLAAVGIFGLMWLLLLVAALTPHRQTVLDWARYRRQQVSQTSQFWHSRMIPDLLWGEKSPVLLAIAVNLGIMALLYVVRVALEPNLQLIHQKMLLAGLGFGMLYILICAAIAQLMLMLKTNKRSAWALGMIAALSIIPVTLLGIFTVSPTTHTLLWMLMPAAAIFATGTAPMMTIFFGLLGQLAACGLLMARLTQQMQKLGESEMKAILAASRV
jgi:cytochrome c-type biogenesis protein CcmH/NrfF